MTTAMSRIHQHVMFTRGGRLVMRRQHLRRMPHDLRMSREISDDENPEDFIRSGQFAILSASKADASDAENEKRTVELINAVMEAGYRVYPAIGYYTYREGPHAGTTVTEQSILVPSMPPVVADRMARRWSQESYIVGSHLRFTSGSTPVVFDSSKTKFGHDANREDAKTEVFINGRVVKFSLQPLQTA